jgi:hypothetical protein
MGGIQGPGQIGFFGSKDLICPTLFGRVLEIFGNWIVVGIKKVLQVPPGEIDCAHVQKPPQRDVTAMAVV